MSENNNTANSFTRDYQRYFYVTDSTTTSANNVVQFSMDTDAFQRWLTEINERTINMYCFSKSENKEPIYKKRIEELRKKLGVEE